MLPDSERAKLRFDLANADLQSIGRAQGLYVTGLLVYVCFFWGLFFSGSHEIALHLAWLDIKIGGVWGITPFVLLVLTLAYIGTVTAAVPAFAKLREAAKEIFGTEEHSMSSLDAHKNITDYLAILQVSPRGKTRIPTDQVEPPPLARRFPHLLLPAIFIGSAFTSFWAILQVYRSQPSTLMPLVFGGSCLLVQAVFSVRPFYRFVARFAGAKRTSDVFN